MYHPFTFNYCINNVIGLITAEGGSGCDVSIHVGYPSAKCVTIFCH